MSEDDRVKQSIVDITHLEKTDANTKLYDEIKEQIRPFDLLAFHGGDVISEFISVIENKTIGSGIFTHVGMVVTSDILPSCKDFILEKDKRYIFESTFIYDTPGCEKNIPDVTTQQCTVGVQLRDLEAVMARYICNDETRVAWCKLKNNPFTIHTKETLMEQFVAFFDDYHGRYYEMSFIGLASSMFPSLRLVRQYQDIIYDKLYNILRGYNIVNKNNEGPAGWQFCSELVANVYQMIGVIGPEFNPQDVLPVDFFGYDLDGLTALVDDPIYIKLE